MLKELATFTEDSDEFSASLVGFVANWCSVGKGDKMLMIFTPPKNTKKSQLVQSRLISWPVWKNNKSFSLH